MTNSQKWIAVFLGLFIALLILTYITEPAEEQNSYNYAEEEITGEKIYADLQCANCHGKNGEGTELGPALENISRNWSKTELINYLRNPSDFANKENIRKLKKQFSRSVMPGFEQTEVKKLGKLADYLLTK